MRIAISGASGLIGSALAGFLTSEGHAVQPLLRSSLQSRDRLPRRSGAEAGEGAPDSGAIHWDPQSGALDRIALAGADALVHLAGRNIALRWTKRHREEIWESRVPATENLCRTLAAMQNPPRTLLSASGISYYGDRGDTVMTEAD